jgi:putative transposase
LVAFRHQQEGRRPTKQRVVTLTQRERKALEDFVSHGKKSAGAITRARILLLFDEGRKERELTGLLRISRGTVDNIGKKYQQKTYAQVLDLLHDAPRSGRPIRLESRVEAKVTRIACSTPPPGRGRWTLQLIADKVVELAVTESISYESVRRVLKKTNSSRG